MWRRFIDFILDMGLDFSETAISKFVAFLYEEGLKYNSIQVYLAAIARGLEARKLPDTTKSPLVGRMILGAKKLTFSRDIRKPITENLLRSIIKVLERLVFTSYEVHLYWAVFTWAFGAGLRVSEYTESKVVDHNLHMSSIDSIWLDGELAYRITFRSYKCCPDEFPDFVLVKNEDVFLCPVASMWHYLNRRPPGDGPLFLTPNGPLKRRDVENVLEKACVLLGWNKTCYHSHSFRIGRATMWAQQGYNEMQIQAMGRWKSDAFKRYIRPAQVVLR